MRFIRRCHRGQNSTSAYYFSTNTTVRAVKFSLTTVWCTEWPRSHKVCALCSGHFALDAIATTLSEGAWKGAPSRRLATLFRRRRRASAKTYASFARTAVLWITWNDAEVRMQRGLSTHKTHAPSASPSSGSQTSHGPDRRLAATSTSSPSRYASQTRRHAATTLYHPPKSAAAGATAGRDHVVVGLSASTEDEVEDWSNDFLAAKRPRARWRQQQETDEENRDQLSHDIAPLHSFQVDSIDRQWRDARRARLIPRFT